MIHTIDVASPVSAVQWDYTGQFIAIAGTSGLVVHQYSKASKEWSEPLKSAVPSVAVEWGLNAGAILCLDADGCITTVSSR